MTLFTAAPKASASKDLLQIKRAVGGQFGEIQAGGVKAQVLKLGQNVYVTTEPPAPGLRVLLNAVGADLHQVKSAADVAVFVQRYKNFTE